MSFGSGRSILTSAILISANSKSNYIDSKEVEKIPEGFILTVDSFRRVNHHLLYNNRLQTLVLRFRLLDIP